METKSEIHFDLPKGWKWVTLGEISKIKGGKRLPKGHRYSESNKKYPYIRVKDFKNMTIDLTDIRFIEEETYEKIKSYTITSKDLYISIAGTIGKVGLTPKSLDGANLTENAAKITEIQNFDNKLLCYFLSSPFAQEQISNFIISTNQPKLALFRIKKIILPLPPLSYQNLLLFKLEELFTQLEAGVTSLKQTQEHLQTYRQALLKAAFEGKLTEKWRELNLKKLIKDDFNKLNTENKSQLFSVKSNKNLDMLNQTLEWSILQISDITEEIEKVKPTENPNGYFTYIDISSIDKYKIVKPKRLLGKNAPSRARQLIRTGDVLFSTVRTYLRNITLVEEINNNQIASTGFCVLRPNKEIIISRFLFYYTLTNFFVNSLSRIQRGSSYPAVRYIDVLNQYIPIPSKIEQEKIIEEIEWRLSIIEKAEINIDSDLLKTKVLKQCILKKAFEGSLIPQLSDKESIENFLTKKSEKEIQIENNNTNKIAKTKIKQARLTDFE